MDSDFIIVTSCLVGAYVLGIMLAIYNIKQLRATKAERLAARKAFKKIKNAKLKRFYNIPDRDQSSS